MKIQDAITAYDFLSKLDTVGVLGFIIGFSLVITFLVASITDKIFDSKALKQKFIVVTILLSIACVCILKMEADNNNDQLYRANNIKEYMLESNEDHCGFIELNTNVNFPEKKSNADRTIEIRKLIKRFPDEFAESYINYADDADTLGVVLVNTATVKLFKENNQKLLPMYKAKLLYYMRAASCGATKGYDTISYDRIRKTIDYRCDFSIVDQLISRNPKLFYSVYAPYDVYDKSIKNGDTMDALMINPDSSMKYLGRKVVVQ